MEALTKRGRGTGDRAIAANSLQGHHFPSQGVLGFVYGLESRSHVSHYNKSFGWRRTPEFTIVIFIFIFDVSLGFLRSLFRGSSPVIVTR